MSETHTQGRIVARDEWLIPEAQADRPIGGSSDKIKDREHYANIVTTVNGKYHDNRVNARRLAACWNACEGIATEVVEKKRPVWWTSVRALTEPIEHIDAELAAARALLEDVARELYGTDRAKTSVRIRAFLKRQP